MLGMELALLISMTVTVHQTVQTMTGQGLEALAPYGEWIALLSEGNLMTQSSLSQRSDATEGATVILDTDAA